MEDRRRHWLVLPIPLQGHINPTIHLLRQLAGLRFTLLVPQADLTRTRRSIAADEAIQALPFPLELSNLSSSGSMGQMLKITDALEAAKHSILGVLQALLQHDPASCLVADLFIQMAQDLANDLSLPSISLWSSSATSLIVNCCLPRLLSEGVVGSEAAAATVDESLMIDFIPGMPGLRRSYLPHSLRTLGRKDLEFRVVTMSRTRKAACILGNTIPELEASSMEVIESVIGTGFIPIGPLFPIDAAQAEAGAAAASPSGNATALWEEDMRCLSWLDRQAPASVLYVSFGSMAMLAAEQIEEIAAGLEASEQPFLWVIRPNLTSSSSSEGAAAASAAKLEGFKERISSRGMIISWAPQLLVLKHSSVGGFLTHCGWNSTMESVCCGVPMLGWPCFAEQHLNCKVIVEDWKVGLRCCRPDDEGKLLPFVAGDEVERAIRRLMQQREGMEMRERCGELAKRCCAAARFKGSCLVDKIAAIVEEKAKARV